MFKYVIVSEINLNGECVKNHGFAKMPQVETNPFDQSHRYKSIKFINKNNEVDC